MDMLKARRIIRNHYGLDRVVTEEEVRAEIANLVRKRDGMGIGDDSQRSLYYQLEVAGCIPK